jgi:hypothetical protein
MTEQHPITPPPELMQEWRTALPSGVFDGYKFPQREQLLCIQAARWGADQELEACLADVSFYSTRAIANKIRAARRPKSPSLKEKALAALARLNSGSLCSDPIVDKATICRALEALPDAD